MSDSTSKRIRALTATIRDYGGENIRVSTGKHYKLKFTNPQGATCTLVVSFSPSDRRADKSNLSILKRLMAQPRAA